MSLYIIIVDRHVRLRHRRWWPRWRSCCAATPPTTVEDRLAVLTGANQAAKNAKQALLKESVLAEPLAVERSTSSSCSSAVSNLRLLFEQADAPLSRPAVLHAFAGIRAWWEAWPARSLS